MTLEVGSELELEIERLAAGGDGVARCDGRALFVPLAAPGDRLRCRVSEVRRRFARAEIVEILTPGPGRRPAPCPYFGRCGGCTWQHLDEATQARARLEILRDALVRIGHFDRLPAIEWLPSPRAYGYRARARMACSEGAVGFRARRSHEVVDVERCMVLDEDTQRELEALRRDPPSQGEREIRGFGSSALGLQVGRGSFFQANAALWERWAELVAGACGEGDLVVELYAGVGFYTVRLERGFERVIAVERARSGGDLRHNTGADVHQTSAERFAMTQLPELAPDVVLLNPPRSGCDPTVIDALGRTSARRIVYVSCDPATLARDLAPLLASHLVRRIVAIDALPQTHGVESMVVLDSRCGAKIESSTGCEQAGEVLALSNRCWVPAGRREEGTLVE